MKKCYKLTIHGRVQGVGYRYATLYKAEELGIKGYVTNNFDTTVSVIAEAEAGAINKFIEWCYEGPRHAIVDEIEKTEIEIRNYGNFRIR